MKIKELMKALEDNLKSGSLSEDDEIVIHDHRGGGIYWVIKTPLIIQVVPEKCLGTRGARVDVDHPQASREPEFNRTNSCLLMRWF